LARAADLRRSDLTGPAINQVNRLPGMRSPSGCAWRIIGDNRPSKARYSSHQWL
jgi:hypothetical protein